MADTKGKAKVIQLGTSQVIGHRQTPDWSFIYAPATSVRDPNFNIGDRVVLPDGRVYRYAKSAGACYTYQLAMFYGLIGVAYTSLLQAQAVGDKSIYLDAGSAAAFAEDALRGGYVVIYGSDNSDVQQRGIVGNTLSDSDGYTTIYLDAALNVAVTTSTGAEVMRNPYGSVLTVGATEYCSVAGLPAVESTAANQYLWIQTWGPCAIAPGESAVCDSAFERSVCADVTVGALHEGGDSGFGTGACQIVGHGLERTTSGNGAVFFSLRLDP
jgi:hypothetical protein